MDKFSVRESFKKSIFAKFALFGLIILVILRIIIYQNILMGREVYFYSDDAIYATLAKRFLAGDFWNGFHPYWSPGFPLFTVPVYFISKSWETSQFLVSVISATILVAVLFWFFKRYSYFLAFIIAFIASFSLSLQQLVVSGGITEPLYLLMLWLGIFFGWSALESLHKSNFIYAGIFFGLAYFTRTEAIVFFALFILLAFLKFVLKKRKKIIFFNKITLIFISFGVITYFYFPISKFAKLTTFNFSIFNSAYGLLFSIPFLVVGLLGIFFEIKKYASLSLLKTNLFKIVFALILFFLINLPYIAIVSLELGRPTLSGKYAFLGTGPYYALEEDRMTTLAQDVWSTDYIDYSSPYFDPRRANNYLSRNLENGALTQNAWKSFLEAITLYKSENNSNFFVGFGLYMAIIGFVLGILRNKFRKLTLYFTLLTFAGLIWVSFFMGPHYRYLVYALPFFFYLQALTIFESRNFIIFMEKVLTERFFLKNIIFLFGIIIPIFFLANFFIKNMGLASFTTIQPSGGHKDHKMLGEWIKSQNIKVMGGRVEAIPFYANAKLVYMPSSPPEDIVRYMKAWGVEFLLVRPMEVGYDFVAPIANPKFKHPNLTLLKRFDEGSLVWRIKLTDYEKENNLRLVREKKFIYGL